MQKVNIKKKCKSVWERHAIFMADKPQLVKKGRGGKKKGRSQCFCIFHKIEVIFFENLKGTFLQASIINIKSTKNDR